MAKKIRDLRQHIVKCSTDDHVVYCHGVQPSGLYILRYDACNNLEHMTTESITYCVFVIK